MIEELWKSLERGNTRPVHIRISQSHPLDLFAQIDTEGRIGLLALSDAHPGKYPPYASVDVFVGKREDGRWATSLSLKQTVLRPLFATICDEIAEQGLKERSNSSTGRFVLDILAHWQRLLALGPDGLLSMEERLGLIGELHTLEIGVGRFGAAAAVEGWKGPLDAPQDFLFPSGFVEVKAVRSGSTEIQISSIEQLDIQDGQLSLVIHEFMQCISGTGGISLAQQVEQVRALLTDDAMTAMKFEQLLRRAGYAERPEYRVDEYRLLRTRSLRIGHDFPRLTRSSLPKAIAEGKYKLVISAIEAFEVRKGEI